jgi:putative transposase
MDGLSSGDITMPFHVCYYHAVWSTNHREPLITAAVEQVLFEVIERKSTALKSPIHAMNTTTDHIHIAVSIAASVAVSDWFKHMKGTSAHEINAAYPKSESRFVWQSSYGVLTFGAKNLSFVIDYIKRQKEHHAQNTLESYLERTEDES